MTDSTIQARDSELRNDPEERPFTIPALKMWEPGNTNYTFGETARIVIASAFMPRLATIGELVAEELYSLSGLTIPFLIDNTGQTGDILLTLEGSDLRSGSEGYSLEIGDRVTIRAMTEYGVFNGTRTLLQLLRQQRILRGGIAHDGPDYPERSLMVDMGRKYFSLLWLENHIRDLAYLKYNYFHFHLSDNYGFRLESERHLEIVSEQHYTKEQIRALIALAQKYHITIVPEIDMPGHMDAILKAYPHLQLSSATGQRRPGDIDLSQEESYQLMRDLLEEYLPLFPGPYWHIGADEYILNGNYANYPQLQAYARERYGPHATGKDTYLGFVNWANAIIKAHGKVTRCWSDGLHSGMAVTVMPDIIYEHWYGTGLTPRQIVDLELLVMNSNADYLYYVLHDALSWRACPERIYNDFEPHIFHGPALLEPLHPRKLGAKFHVWCDSPEMETEEQIAAGIEYGLRALAQKNWGGSKSPAAYERFAEMIKQLGHAPGFREASAEAISHERAALNAQTKPML